MPRRVLRGLDDEAMAELRRLLDVMHPVSLRAAGVRLDERLLADFDLEPARVRVPALVVHARDDALVGYDGAARAAAALPQGEMLTVERGGHFLAGHWETVRRRLERFLRARDSAGP